MGEMADDVNTGIQDEIAFLEGLKTDHEKFEYGYLDEWGREIQPMHGTIDRVPPRDWKRG